MAEETPMNIYEQYAEATKDNVEIQNSYKYLF
jgi:hypothetical protein